MENVESKNNIIYIQFFNKTNLPKGKWSREPDYCEWEFKGYQCLAVRDMTLGIWSGLVGLNSKHPAHHKSLLDIFTEKWGLNILIHGGISIAGKLPFKLKNINKELWWFGFQCHQEDDLIPLIELPDGIKEEKSYKDLIFVRKEVHELVNQLDSLKTLWAH